MQFFLFANANYVAKILNVQIYKKFDSKAFKDVVARYAKYQKVMLFFDENVSNLQLEKLHNSIKEICIFNKTDISTLNEKEIYNGYKLLIFVCSANSFLKINFNLEEFVNIFIPVTQDVLPFFFDSKNKTRRIFNTAEIEIGKNNLKNTNFIFMPQGVDVAVFYSFYFNNIISCFNSILFNENLNFQFKEIEFFTQQSELEFLKNNLEFIDIKILKQLNLDYKFLPYLDYYFLLAFSVLITAIKQKNLTMVDVYKQAKENYKLIDLYYAKIKDDAFYCLINLNFLSLKNALSICFKNLTKIKLDELTLDEKNCLIKSLKNFCKNDDGFFVYLFLFNVFE